MMVARLTVASTALVLLTIFVAQSVALNNGLGLLPQMGYNTWNDYQCQINADDLKNSADAIKRQGLDKLGYVYVNLDDCWAVSRSANGTIVEDPKGFPNGMKAVADYVHSLGLKFGIYTDRGTMTCQRRPGSLGYEKIDAMTYASWGVDYLKEDSCYASSDHPTAFKQYGTMRDALNATGRQIFFSLCGWADWYAPVGASLGNSWRIAGDCYDWKTVVNAINVQSAIVQYSQPGAWNDPDMLIGSSNTSAFHMEPYQSRTQFSMWAVMTAPLLIGSSITNLPPFDLATYSNKVVIGINQDKLAIPGVRVAGGNLVQSAPGKGQSTWNVWAKPLSNQATALILLNAAGSNQDVTCDVACFAASNLTKPSYAVWDAWSNTRIGTASPKTGFTSKNLQALGGSQLLILAHAGLEEFSLDMAYRF